MFALTKSTIELSWKFFNEISNCWSQHRRRQRQRKLVCESKANNMIELLFVAIIIKTNNFLIYTIYISFCNNIIKLTKTRGRWTSYWNWKPRLGRNGKSDSKVAAIWAKVLGVVPNWHDHEWCRISHCRDDRRWTCFRIQSSGTHFTANIWSHHIFCASRHFPNGATEPHRETISSRGMDHLSLARWLMDSWTLRRQWKWNTIDCSSQLPMSINYGSHHGCVCTVVHIAV